MKAGRQQILKIFCSSIFINQCIVPSHGICWLKHTKFYSIPYAAGPDQTVIVPEQSVANESDDTPRDGHGGQADGGLLYNADACPSAFNLKIGYLPIPNNPIPRLSQSHWLVKKDHARTSSQSMCSGNDKKLENELWSKTQFRLLSKKILLKKNRCEFRTPESRCLLRKLVSGCWQILVGEVANVTAPLLCASPGRD